MGPNKTELVIRKLCSVMVPPGAGDPLRAMTTAFAMLQAENEAATAAVKWTELQIKMVRDCSEPNPYKKADDELIAERLILQTHMRNPQAAPLEREASKAIQDYWKVWRERKQSLN